MKTNSTKFIYLLLFSTILFWGCSDDDDETADTIIGTWAYEYYGDKDGMIVHNPEEELFLYRRERIFSADSTAIYRFSMEYSDGRIGTSEDDLGKFTIKGNEILYESGQIERFKIEKNTIWLTLVKGNDGDIQMGASGEYIRKR